jgi:hypothetical protein
MEEDNTSLSNKRMGWIEQRRIVILECEGIIRELVPCSTDRIIAEIEYRTGLSYNKAQEVFNIFLKREVIKIIDKKVQLCK